MLRKIKELQCKLRQGKEVGARLLKLQVCKTLI